MDPQVVYSLIQLINRGQARQVETQLESLRTSNVNDLVLTLLTVILDQQHQQRTQLVDEMTVVGQIQSALLILKTIIPKSWSPRFTEFKGGSPISDQVKSTLRSGLLNLLGFSKSKVRSVTALLIAKIASGEHPKEWPDLIDNLLHMLQHGDSFQIYGSLSAIKELVSGPISDNQFAKDGPSIILNIYKVASSPKLPGDGPDSTGKYSPHASAVAIEVFRQCIEFLLVAEETQSPLVNTFVIPVIDQWSPLFIKYIGMPIDTSDKGSIDLKLESLKTYKAFLTALPRLASGYALAVFEATLHSTWHVFPSYERIFINNNNENGEEESQPDFSKANDFFIHPNLTLDNLVLEQLDFLCMAVELNSVVDKLANALPDFIDLLIRLGQIPKNQETWENDVDEFVLEESETSVGHLGRTQITEILAIASKCSSFDLIPLLWDRIMQLTLQIDSWKIKESGLYLFSRVLAEGECNTLNLTSTAITQFVQLASKCQHDPNSLLRSRAFLSAASVCRSLTNLIDTPSIKLPLFETTMDAALSDNNDTVRISCIMAIRKYCMELPHEYFLSKEQMLYQAIYLISEKIQNDTPAVLAEVIVAVAECDLSQAARNPDLVTLIYKLVSKDPTNAMLTNEIQDVMAEIAETATDEGIYSEFIQNAMKPLAESILSIKDWDYSPELVLSLNILGVLVDNGPYPLPENIVSTFFYPLVQIAMNSSDNQVLQTVTENLAFFTQHAADQIKDWLNKEGQNGVELMIMAVDRLLDPIWLDSACINTGLLILAIVQNFGSLLGDLLPQMLTATVNRMATAKSPALIENFLLVFSKLVSTSAKEVVDILAETEVNGVSGLQVVVSEWLANFDALRGYDEIKEK